MEQFFTLFEKHPSYIFDIHIDNHIKLKKYNNDEDYFHKITYTYKIGKKVIIKIVYYALIKELGGRGYIDVNYDYRYLSLVLGYPHLDKLYVHKKKKYILNTKMDFIEKITIANKIAEKIDMYMSKYSKEYTYYK